MKNNSAPNANHSHGLTILPGFLVIVIYVWLISAGLWITWPRTTNYYAQLATAFQHGQLFLKITPDSALVALPNPYDPGARSGIPVLLDASLYKGRYYLYFGPVPALLLLIIKPLFSGAVGDQYLVFMFTSGVFIIQSLLIVTIYERLFQDIPRWTVSLGILTIGLIGPASWILRTPYIYSAPIVSGQFFFLSGFYSALIGLTKPSSSKLAFAVTGTLWAGAIGSRINQALPVSFMTVMVIVWILQKNNQETKKFLKSIPMVISLGIPLAIGFVGLGLYNWARFDSVFETGVYYQLTGPDLQKYWHDLFSPSYIFQNLYNYLFIPPEIKARFPFLNPTRGNMSPMIFSFPKIYYSQEITGLLCYAPFILFAVIPVINLLRMKKHSENNMADAKDWYLIQWLILGLLGSFLTGVMFYLAFFWAATRYAEDFFPPLALLSVIGFFQGYRYFSRNPINRNLYTLIGFSLAIISIVASSLLAIAINSSGFREVNPLLWKQLVSFFSQ
jgi:F0F1-type ATP synthase assembly protein I